MRKRQATLFGHEMRREKKEQPVTTEKTPEKAITGDIETRRWMALKNANSQIRQSSIGECGRK